MVIGTGTNANDFPIAASGKASPACGLVSAISARQDQTMPYQPGSMKWISMKCMRGVKGSSQVAMVPPTETIPISSPAPKPQESFPEAASSQHSRACPSTPAAVCTNPRTFRQTVSPNGPRDRQLRPTGHVRSTGPCLSIRQCTACLAVHRLSYSVLRCITVHRLSCHRRHLVFPVFMGLDGGMFPSPF